ncbi:MAG TPA: hemolysin family protein [Patescibacteria group bacterium]
MDILLQFFLIAFFISLNGFFVLCEFSLVSVRKTRMEELASSGNRRAKMVIYAINNLSTYLSATQFGITLASLALGWLGEPTLARFFASLFESSLPGHILFLSSHIIAIAVAFAAITFLQIIFGELAPKTTALQNPEKLVFIVIVPLMAFTAIFKPFVWFLKIAATGLLRLFGISSKTKNRIHSEEEIKLILSQSAKMGEIDQHEADIIYRVFKIGDLPISTIMVPKKEVIAFSKDTGVWKIAKDITEDTLHTRFPIFNGNLDTVVGYVSVTDMYVFSKTLKEDIPVEKTDLIRKTLHIHENKRIDDVLTLMKQTGVHLGIVVDSHDKTKGIVSIEDIIESLVGELKEQEG